MSMGLENLFEWNSEQFFISKENYQKPSLKNLFKSKSKSEKIGENLTKGSLKENFKNDILEKPNQKNRRAPTKA